MRYFKIVLACFGFIFAVVGITVGVLFLTGKFDKEVVQPADIAFEITEKLTEDDFEVKVVTTTENATEKDVTLSLTNQTESDGMISDGVITIPKVVKLGQPFVVKVNKTHYAGMTQEWNVGGTSVIRAKSTNPLIQEAKPLTVEVDVPVHSIGVELVTTSGTKIGTVAARDMKNYMKTLAEGDEDKNVVELAVGSVVRLKPVFTPEKSAYTTKGEQRKVLFEIPTAWKGIHIDFVDGENDLIEVLRQTTVEDIKINAYCFRTSADEYAAQDKGYTNDELITMMNSTGISGESAQIFGTNQKITSFTSATKDEYLQLAINTPTTLIANGTSGDNAFDLGLNIASDAGVARLEDKIAVIKLFAYLQNDLGEWEDAGDKLIIVGQSSSNKANGVRAKINKNDANLSSWKAIAGETGKYKLVVNLSYEYYSSSSSVPTIINFDIEYNNIMVSDPISSDVSWKNTLPAIKTLVVLDGETQAEKYYPTLNLSDYVDIKNPNATYKVVRYFAYSTEGANLKNILDCSLYDGNFEVPDSSYQYEVFEIPNGILTAKDVGSFRIFFATVVSDYLGNPKIQFGQYLFESFSNTNTINVVKSLKNLDASMAVNVGEDGKDYNKNTDENTNGYIFHVRQQDEKVFTLSLYVSDIEIFERDYADGKISIDFLLGGEKSNILAISGEYQVDEIEKRIDFQVSVNALPDNNQPTLECKITYELDHRLDKFVSNNGNKVQIKVLNGFAQQISFDAVKDANPKNSAENPIQVEINFNAGSDNIATNVEYSITLNGQNLILEDLSKVTINEDALNKTYTMSSSKPAVIAVEDAAEGAKLSILGSTQDEDVVITATAADGSGLSTSIYFKVLASLQITMTPNESEITIDGYQGNQINFRSYFDAKAGDIDLNNLIHYNVPIENTNKFAFADDTLKVVSTLGRDASLQLYVTSDFGFTKIIPIRIVSNITATSTYALNDQGLDDADFVERGETPPAERGTRVYAENSREISFVITQEKPTSTNISISVDDFELPKNGGIQSIAYGAGVLTICFDAVSQMTEKTIIFKKNFSENDEYAFVYTMKFLVFPNIRASFVSSQGTEQNPASYVSGETVIYDAKNNSNGLIKLERILGSNIISEHAVLQAKINGEWVALSSNSGVFVLPSTYRATEGGFVEIKIIYDGYAIAPIQIFLTPFFEDSILLDAKVLYGGKLYVPFIAEGDNPIALSDADGVVYSIVNATSEQYLRIRGKQIEKLDRLYTKIISSEKLRIENKNGATELPILILPVKYPFVLYSMIAGADQEETYRTVDLKQVIESETICDSLEAGGEEVIDLKSKLLVDGLNDGGAIVTVVNADGSTNKYVNFDQQNLTLSANPVGKDQMIYVNVKCGAEFEEAFAFTYRVKITANQQIKVFYPYIEYTEDYNVDNAYEYLYFGSKNQVSVDLLEEFDANKTPNRALLEQLFETTNGNVYARRFVVVRDKDGKLIPLDYKDLHFEIASVGIGKTVIPVEQISNYATINEKTTTSGELESANLFINRGQATETIYVTIRAYTSSGAEAYYRFRVGENPVAYKVYYKNQRVTSDDFSVASNGQSDINLNESVLVKIDENPEQVVSSNAYKFYLIIHEKLGTDYSQFIKLDAGHIQISTLVNDVETTIVIYNAAGEIARFNLILKCTIDHEIKSTTIGVGGGYDIGSSIDFFNTTQSTSNYSMQEISTRLYVKDYLNGSDIGTTLPNNLFINIGGYSIKDISKDYNQYVLLDNIKVYAENLFDTWGGKFYVGDDAKYDILSDYDGKYVRYNGSVIRIRDDKYFDIPLQSTTDTQTVSYQISEDGTYVIIPHLKFSSGNDTRDYVLFDLVFHPEEAEDKQYKVEPYGVEHGEYSFTTYVYAYVNGYVRYKVETKTELKVSILRVSHNNVQYIASVDGEHNDDEYIVVDDQKHYFTRFYRIDYDGLAENKQGETENVPKIRYMLKNDETTIDLSKVLFFTQEGYSDNVLKLDGNEYKDGLFSFFVDDGSGNLQSVDFVKTQGENPSATWEISVAENRFQPINIVIQDTTAKFVVGRVTIVPTVETSTNSAENNKTLFVEAGSNDIDYKLNKDTLALDDYKAAMGSGFSGVIGTDHAGWKNYVYSVNSEYGLSIDSNGEVSGLFEKSPWKESIIVGAQLRYNATGKELTTTIPYETWKNEFFGTSLFTTFGELTSEMSAQNVLIELADGLDGPELGFDANGNIKNVAYGSIVTITFKQLCEKCGEKISLGDTHECWFVSGTETIMDLSVFSEEQLNTLAGGDSFEILDEGDTNKKYVYVLTGDSTLTKDDETGVWTLSGSITKTTLNKHTFNAQFAYQEEKSGEVPLTLGEEPKESEEDPTTYGLIVSADDLQAVWSGLGFASFVDFKNSITSISSSAGAVVVEDTGITISGSSQQNITLSYVVNVPKTLEKTSSTCEIDALNLNDGSGYSTLAKALFGAGAENILGYTDWNAVLSDCDISFDGGYNSDDKTFGRGKIITLTLITKDPKHTGTFYLVNQEHGNKTLHETGNLDKLGLSGDYESENKIASVVEIGGKWILPMATTKYLIGGTGNEKLQEIIANYTSGLTDYYVVWKDKALDNESGYDLETFVFGENTELKTAAELTGDPFNTLTIYQHGYAIANIHIYLEDYAGDNSYNKYKIYSSAPSETSLKIENRNEEGEVVSSVEFVVENNLLTTILTTKDAADKEKVTYLTQNAKMTDNQYLFSNGLLVEYDGTNIKLKMIAKSAPLSFEFEGVDFNYDIDIDSTSDVTEQNYFEGLVDLMEQSTCDNFSKGNKTYKAEKTGNAQDDSDVVYKDKIEGSDFNFDNWEFATSYENENGATMEASGKEVTIVNLGDNKQIKIVITKIKDAEGNLIEGGYTFVVDLVEKSAVTIIGGGENGATGPSSPLDGGTIASSQTKTINLKGDVFDVDQTSAEITVDYSGEKGKDAEADAEEMINALFDRNSLSYLKGVLNDEGYTYSSNVFRFKKDGDVTTISIIFTSEAEEREYVIVYDDVTDEETGKTTRKFSLVDSDGTLSEGYTFEIQLNTDLYDFVGKIQQLDEPGALPGEGLSEGGKTPGSEEENGSESEGGTEEPLPPAEPSKQLVITITPVFTYNHKIESNGSAVKIESFDNETGALTLTGNHTSVDTVVKFRFSVLRGRGESAKEVAFAYSSLAVKPSVGVVVTYPTISTKDGEVAQTTEYFYAGAGEFDINAKSNLSVGSEAARMAITRYAYGTDNNKTATYEVNGENVTISVDEKVETFEKNENNVYTISGVGSFYIPTLEVSYTASSSQNIIKGQDGGIFTFDFSDVSVSEANVVISVQAKVGGNTYTFGQYSLTVCKNPVISTLITTEDGHLDENGAEILPIDGGTDLEPFNEAINGTPRLQFVYNNLILSSDYNSSFKANGDEISGFTIPQNKIDADAQSVAFKFDEQKVSGEYKYKRVWDFKMNPTLDSHTIEGIYDPNNPSELLNYYYLDAGKIYNIVETFGITKYFGQKFDKEIVGLKHDVADNKCVELVSGGQGMNIKGAPNGGMNVKLAFKPYENSNEIVVGITILPSLQININYQTETIYGDDPYVYGLISNSQSEYNLVVNSVGQDFSITRDGTTAQINESDFHFVVVSDDGVGAVIEQTTTAATLKISTPPTLNAKRVVIKISDNYGYVEYLRYVVAAKTQVEISTSDITFTTGGKIDWNDNTFPIQFKKENEETTQLASFYTATISSSPETNVRDSYGDVTSLKAKGETLYGVQLGALITLTNGEDESYYVPFVDGDNVSYDVYKLAAKDSGGNDVVLKSFDKYEKIQVKFNGHTWKKDKDGLWLDNTSTEDPDDYVSTEDNLFDDYGNLIPQKDGGNYITNYVIKFFSSSTSENPVATMAFDLLQVQSTDNLYYASRTNADDCYTFEYSILIDGTEIVEGKNIKDIGNAQYGAAQSLNTTLEIAVYDGEKTAGKKPVDTINVPILLKFGIYPQITQQVGGLTSFDYVGLGDKIQGVLTNKKANIKLVADSSVEGFAEPTPKYSITLGIDGNSSLTGTFEEMEKVSGQTLPYTAAGVTHSYSNRVLSLTANLDEYHKATINNIQYTYDSTKKTLTIGYRVVSLADGEFVDDVTGITYKVDGTTLSVSKAVDNANTVTINNKKYSISNNGTTIDYETLYERIFVVWQYNGNKYWAQWNYKVVDKFNQVTTSDPLEAQDGVVKVKLDWVSGDYRFNPNTLKFTDGTNTYDVVRRSTVFDSGYYVEIGDEYTISYKSDGTFDKITYGDGQELAISDNKFTIGETEYTISYKSDGSVEKITYGDGQELTISDNKFTIKTEYKIVITGAKMKFEVVSGTGNTNITSLALTEEKGSNTSWADKIKLTGLDQNETSLKDAQNVGVYVNGSVITDYVISASDLSGTTWSVEIKYTGIDGKNALKLNGNDVKVTFEHFSATA